MRRGELSRGEEKREKEEHLDNERKREKREKEELKTRDGAVALTSKAHPLHRVILRLRDEASPINHWTENRTSSCLVNSHNERLGFLARGECQVWQFAYYSG
jgi:hypothetical protein